MSTSRRTVNSYENPALKRRRVTAFLGLTAVVVGGTAAFTAVVWPGFAVAEPIPVSAQAYSVAPPQLLVEPHARVGAQTALVAALPDVVTNWVQAGVSGYVGWLGANDAVEAWSMTYVDGAVTEQADEIRLTVGQWASTGGASSFLNVQTKEAPDAIISGEVTVAATGQVVGKYLLFEQDSVGVMWWRNGTVVMKAVGPIELLPKFYSAFPL